MRSGGQRNTKCPSQTLGYPKQNSKVAPSPRSPAPRDPSLQRFSPPQKRRVVPARPLVKRGVLVPLPENCLPPRTDSCCCRTARSPYPDRRELALPWLETTAAKKAISQPEEQGLSAAPAAASSLALARPPQPRRLGAAGKGRAEGLAEGRGGRGRRAPPLGARARIPARRIGPPRPAAPPPPWALRSRDVRAPGQGTLLGAGRRAETDPGSIRAGSWQDPGRRLPVSELVHVPGFSLNFITFDLRPSPLRPQVASVQRTCPTLRTGE